MEQSKTFNSWVRHALIKLYIEEGNSVCEVQCGKSVGLVEFHKAKVKQYMGIDSNHVLLEEANKRWKNQCKELRAQFLHFNLIKRNIKDKTQTLFDVVFCQDRMGDATSDATRLLNFLHNVSAVLKTNGYFFGYMMDGSVIWTRIQKSLEAKSKNRKRKRDRSKGTSVVIGNSFYRLEYQINSSGKIPPLGSKYTLQFFEQSFPSGEDVDDISTSNIFTYSLIHPPTLIKYASRVGLQLVDMTNFLDFYGDNRLVFGKSLRRRGIVDRSGSIPAAIQEFLGLFTVFLFRKTSHSERDTPNKADTQRKA